MSGPSATTRAARAGAASLAIYATALALTPPHGRGGLPGGALSSTTGCEAFGPDFHRIEGSDSCIRISGSVRVEGSYTTGGGSVAPRR